MRKPKSVSLLKSADFELLDGRAICVLAAEDAGAAVMICEGVVCLPRQPSPLFAQRSRTDYSTLAEHRSKRSPAIEELRHMRLLAGGALRRHITEKEPGIYARFVSSGHHLFVDLDEDEFTEIILAERSVYPFQFIFEQIQCRCLREYLGDLLKLPQISRTISPF
jgi:hypothetical protein